MVIPTGYDPITLNHWLWFKYQCHECTFPEFQRLFENIIKRAKPEFMQIRPYGRLGDRKCDGLFRTNSTVFQVYSPDELKQSEVLKKINEDLDGAVKHWGEEMKKWVFVYNARRGIAPDIPKMLENKQKEYPDLRVEHLSNDSLWEVARGLTLQQRSEVLGAPSGYEHLFMVPGISENDTQKCIKNSWFVLVQDLLSPINLFSVVEALKPDMPFGAPFYIRPTYDKLPWLKAFLFQYQLVADIMSKSRDHSLPRFAVFSLAPIPLAIHLGFLLSDRVAVNCFQYHRDKKTWRWPDLPKSQFDLNIRVSGLPNRVIGKQCETVIRISLSAKIQPEESNEVLANTPVEIDIFVDQPDVMWLQSSMQLERFQQIFRDVLANIRSNIPRCSQIHLFYAGPTGVAVIIGQLINPRMNPPVRLYEYSRQTKPRYRWALTLEDK